MSRLFLTLSLLLLLFSCKKEEENTAPQIVFTSPTENQSYQAGDTIQITAQLRDNQKIKAASLFLVESNTKLTKGKTKSFNINAKEYTLSYTYVLPKNGLNSNAYYFEIQADDGQLKSAEFLSIRIYQQPRVKKGWLLVKQNGALTTLFELDSIGKSLIKIIDVSSDYKDFAIDMPYQQLWLLPKGKYDLLTIDLEQKVIVHRIIPQITQFTDAFSALLYFDGQTFVGDSKGLLQAYNAQFSDVFTYRSDQDYRTKLLDANGTNLLVVEQANDLSKSRIRILYRISGGVFSSNVISKNVRAVKMITSLRAYLLCDYNNGVEIFEYDINRGAYTSLLKYPLSPNEQLKGFQMMKDNHFLLTTNQKLYNYIPPKKLKLISTATIENATYDPIADEIYLLTNDSLLVLDGNNLARKHGMSLNGTFKAVIPWYSR